MKTTIKELFSSRIAVLAVVLAAILGVCAFSFSSIQQNAWADEGSDGLLTKEWSAFTNEEATYTATEGDITVNFNFEARTITVTNNNVEKDSPETILSVNVAEGAEGSTYSIKAIQKAGGFVTLDMSDTLSSDIITQVTLKEKPAETKPAAEGGQGQAAPASSPSADGGNADGGSAAGTAEGADPAPASDDPAAGAAEGGAKGDPAPATEATVTFDMGGHGAQPADITVAAGEAIANMPDKPTEEGWEFLDWFTDKDLTQAFDASAKIDADTTLYAKWEKAAGSKTETITVSFEMNGQGTAPGKITIDKGTAAGEIAEPTAEGYTFKGWFTDKDLTQAYDPAAKLNADTTLYAKWEENKEDDSASDPTPDDSATAAAAKSAPAPAADFSIVISKTDARTGENLAGADLSLKDADGNVITSWTTDANGGVLIEGLNRSTTYVLSETAAPDGYNREKDINIKFSDEDGNAVVKIDQGGSAVALANNNDGIASLNVKDLSGTSLKGSSTTAPRTGDDQNLPFASLCFAAVALVAGGVAATAYRKRHSA